MSIATRLPAQERRAAILDAAIRLFAEKGFRGTTTRELAAAVGVTEPVLYQHFPSKRDLYNAIIEFKMEQQDARDPALLADFETSTEDEHLLRRLADAILLSFEQDAEFVRLLLYSALEGHELADLVHERRVERHLNVLARYLGRRMKDGV
jgi:AcrR family transcriptional regulator